MQARMVKQARNLSIDQALQWAFGAEFAQLDFDDLDHARPGVSGIWVMMQRGQLGCQIDGGGRSRPHDDAEVIANAVAALPNVFGGRAMAVQIAALARAGMMPDAMVGAVPQCRPKDWRITKHGQFAKTETIGRAAVTYRGRKVVHDVVVCPITFSPSLTEIQDARRRFVAWWVAMDYLRATLAGKLSSICITDQMPPKGVL